jgi:AraC-like DNA-binding protein
MKKLFPDYSIGHFINQPSNKTEFEINLFEDMVEPDVDDVHKHNFYEILWVDEGTSQQTIDFQTYQLGPKSLFFISPGQVHEFEAWQGLRGGTIMFTEDFFLRNQQNKDRLFEISFLDNVYFNPNLFLGCQDFAMFRNYINMLLAEHNRQDANPEILQSLLHILLLQVQRSIKAESNQPTERRNIILFKQFKNLLEAGFTEGKKVADYAKDLNITQHHLNRIAKVLAGQTAGTVIKSRTLLEAKRLLSYSDYSIAEIASHLHYFDASYFSKTFKSMTGQSPLEFKMQMSEKYRKETLLL